MSTPSALDLKPNTPDASSLYLTSRWSFTLAWSSTYSACTSTWLQANVKASLQCKELHRTLKLWSNHWGSDRITSHILHYYTIKTTIKDSNSFSSEYSIFSAPFRGVVWVSTLHSDNVRTRFGQSLPEKGQQVSTTPAMDREWHDYGPGKLHLPSGSVNWA